MSRLELNGCGDTGIKENLFKFFSIHNPKSLRYYLIRGATGSFIIALAANALSLMISIVMARLMGPTELGRYAYIMATIQLLLIPSMIGFPQLIIREAAAYQTMEEWGLLKGFIQYTKRITLFASTTIVIISASIVWFFWRRSGALLWGDIFFAALTMVPLLALIQIYSSTIRGFGYILTSQIPQVIIRPALFIFSLLSLYLLTGKGNQARQAIIIQLAVTFITFLIALFFLRRVMPKPLETVCPVYNSKRWMQSALPLFFISGMHLINYQTDTLMLGIIKGPLDVGIYRIAQRGAMIVNIILMAFNTTLSPSVSILYAKKEIRRLQRILIITTRAVTILTLPILIILIFFGSQILTLVFGVEFAPAYLPLTILCVAYLVTILMGPLSMLLNMSGHERDTAKGFTVSAISNIVFNALLIPFFGTPGAALATGISMIVFSFYMVVIVQKRIGINITFFARFVSPR